MTRGAGGLDGDSAVELLFRELKRAAATEVFRGAGGHEGALLALTEITCQFMNSFVDIAERLSAQADRIADRVTALERRDDPESRPKEV